MPLVVGVPPLLCGQFAEVIVQVLPAVVSVQALMAVLPAASLESTAPLKAVSPSSSVAMRMRALVKSERAALAALLTKRPPWPEARRCTVACEAAARSKSRAPVARLVPGWVPCGTISGCAGTAGW